MTQTIAILGAGLTGLSAAWSLATRGHKVVVTERDATVGGLAKSVSYQGFTFDIGPIACWLPRVVGSGNWYTATSKSCRSVIARVAFCDKAHMLIIPCKRRASLPTRRCRPTLPP